MIRRVISRFWVWYEDHYLLNIGIAAGLFLLQLVHLYWLTADVVALRLIGRSFFEVSGIWESLIILVDYTEIPALITTSLIYINELRRRFTVKSLWFLFFINSQWLHIFWITDEFVLEQFTGIALVVMPVWLVWTAIFIDYLELPVIVDTIKKFLSAIKQKKILSF